MLTLYIFIKFLTTTRSDLWITRLQRQLEKAPKEEWVCLDSLGHMRFKAAERKKERIL